MIPFDSISLKAPFIIITPFFRLGGREGRVGFGF
jgi:hypothetical protein